MSKVIFFDAGPVISLVMSRLTFIIPELKKHYGGKFYITPAVKKELVDRPLTIKRFRFEALQVMRLIREGVLEVYENVPQDHVNKLIDLANSSFKINDKFLEIIQSGEMESVACALQEEATVVMDERTLRLFIENNKEMSHLLGIRFKKKVDSDASKVNQFSTFLKKINIIRSIELAGVAYQLGLLDPYIPKLKNGKETLLDAVLWTVKFNGCAVTEHEIEEIKAYLLK